MSRGVMELYLVENPLRHFCVIGLIERCPAVRVEVVNHHPQDLGVRVGPANQMLDEFCKILLCPLVGDSRGAPSRLELCGHENVGATLPDVLVIVPFRTARPHRYRFSGVAEKLFWLLVKADNGPFGVTGLCVQVEDVIHPFPKLGSYLRDAPHLLQPRLSFRFFKTSRMLSRLIVAKSFLFFSSSVNNLIVHLFLPNGGAVHAAAIISVSFFSVYFLGCPGLGFSFNAESSPSSRYLFLILHTLCLWTLVALEITSLL